MKRNHFSALKRTILVSMILVPFIPFSLSLGIGYHYFMTSLEQSTISSMKRIVEDHRHMIESFLKERMADLLFVCEAYTFQELSEPENLNTTFYHLQRKSQAFFDLGLFNDAGVHVAYHGPYKLTGKIYDEAYWFQESLERGYYISDIFLGYRNFPHFVIAVTRQENGKKWVIRSTIDTLVFNDLVEKVRIGKTGEAFILDAKGHLQTKPRSGGELMAKFPDHIAYPTDENGIEPFISKSVSGDQYLYATTWLQGKKWLLVVRQEKADAFKALRSATYLIVLIAMLGGGAIVGLAFYLTNYIVGRMERTDAEKVQLSQQLIGASRLAELGEMAAGFAHEINNPLQIIKNEQSLMEMIISEMIDTGNLKESESLTEFMDSMDQIKIQISRCADITQSILKFGRQSEPKPKNIDLAYFIPEVINMISNKAAVHGITVTNDIPQDIPPIYGDATQFQQVLLNLFNNAMDAITEKHGFSGGMLMVTTEQNSNGLIEIQVKDNGSGISPENMEKIFSPFFTTKPVGKGTGLGLSVCYGIIKDMGGAMEVSSEKEKGTTFRIRLPVTELR